MKIFVIGALLALASSLKIDMEHDIKCNPATLNCPNNLKCVNVSGGQFGQYLCK